MSPRSNTIVAIALDGSSRTLWAANAPFDAWHVNCVAQHDGRLYATAFGRFDRARGWDVNCERTGMLFDVETNEDVVTGLTQPHTPRWIDGAWTICDSGSGALVRVSSDGRRHLVQLGGFPRGLCVVGQRVYVGVSERRTSREQSVTAHIVVLERSTWTELERIRVDAGSVYDIVPVDRATLEGLRVGFHFPSRRRRTLDQLAMFEAAGVRPSRLWAVGERLSSQDCRITIDVAIPPVLPGGDIVPLHCTVTNRGSALLVTAPPYPVLLSYKWIDRATGALVPGLALRTALPATLPPGQSIDSRRLRQGPNHRRSIRFDPHGIAGVCPLVRRGRSVFGLSHLRGCHDAGGQLTGRRVLDATGRQKSFHASRMPPGTCHSSGTGARPGYRL